MLFLLCIFYLAGKNGVTLVSKVSGIYMFLLLYIFYLAGPNEVILVCANIWCLNGIHAW